MPLNHMLKCHIYTFFEHLQVWGLNHFTGQPVPMPDPSFSKEIFPNIQSKPDRSCLLRLSWKCCRCIGQPARHVKQVCVPRSWQLHHVHIRGSAYVYTVPTSTGHLLISQSLSHLVMRGWKWKSQNLQFYFFSRENFSPPPSWTLHPSIRSVEWAWLWLWTW